MKGFIKNIVIYHGQKDNYIVNKIIRMENKAENKRLKQDNKTYKVVKNGKEVIVQENWK